MEGDLALQTDKMSSFVFFACKDPSEVGTDGNMPQTIDFDIFDFEINVPKPGDSATVTFYFDTPIPEGHGWFKHFPDTGWQAFSGPNSISEDRMSASMTLTDGGPSDQDGEANGVIADPAAMGASSTEDDSSKRTESSTSESPGECIYDPDAKNGVSWLLLLMIPTMLRLFYAKS